MMVAPLPGSSRGPDGRAYTKAHYAGRHAAKAKGVRRRAYPDAATRCRRCGLTLEERRVTHPAETWDAGHVIAGQVKLDHAHRVLCDTRPQRCTVMVSFMSCLSPSSCSPSPSW